MPINAFNKVIAMVSTLPCWGKKMQAFLRFSLCSLLLVTAMGQARADDALYSALGGQEKIQSFTRDFVQIISTDPRISHFFVDTDLVRLELLLAEQFCNLAGGPCTYGGRSMKELHKDLKVMNKDFNALAEDLIIAMERAGIPNRARNQLINKLAPMQRDIVVTP